MTQIVIAWIRTTVPTVVGAVVTYAAVRLNIDAETSTELVVPITAAGTALLTSIYYLSVRLLAERWPWVGSLLGVNKVPTYDV